MLATREIGHERGVAAEIARVAVAPRIVVGLLGHVVPFFHVRVQLKQAAEKGAIHWLTISLADKR